ncbi:MAG: molybdopterin-dependent oxidoreductase [Chloroflexi bacterium]|nr:molybdopterin-dependent oxidoreductase [Chloroflexota bacterium]
MEDERQTRIIQALIDRHAGEETTYTGCLTNCGANSACALKMRVKDGRITVVEPDDRYNTGIGREDRILSDMDLVHAKVQRRGCPMAWAWDKLLYQPDRILYPMLREPGSRRGEGRFRRISWDDALDIIVEKMEECRRKYGPYSLMTPYMPNKQVERLFSFWGAGVDTWGWCSADPERLGGHLMAGKCSWSGDERRSSSAADMMMNSKLIVLWGLDPAMGHYGPGHQLAWYMKMARERGTPVICLDPRYSTGAEVMADQWLPIKPGTDMAFILAVAYVLFKEDLYNKEFVARTVEPSGFQKWRRQVMGEEDGVPKTPQWAEAICGLPAQTIVEFTRLYARSKPTWLYKHWAVARKSYGENSVRGAATLQAMMGYFGVPGGMLPFEIGSWPLPEAVTNWPTGGWGEYEVPKICRSHKWAQAVLLLDQVKSVQMTAAQWRTIVGYRADPQLPIPQEFNPKFLWWGSHHHTASNFLNTATDSTGDQLKALARIEFMPHMHTTWTPTARYADLVLPALDWMFEGQRLLTSAYGGFSSLSYCPGVVKPAGEVRSVDWVFTKLAQRLGFADKFNPYYTTDESWEADWDRFQQDLYRTKVSPVLSSHGIEAPPWDKFKESRFIHLDEYHDQPFQGYEHEVKLGFKTGSGKFEVSAEFLDEDSERGEQHYDTEGRLYSDLPNDFRDLPSIPRYQPSVGGMEDPAVARYPLMMLSCHSRYRVHSTFWNVPWVRGDCYRHAVWLSVADAKARGIADGETARVFNDKGEIRLPAYVTSRLMPGIIVVRQGSWYQEENGNVSHVLLGDSKSPLTAPHTTAAVQVEKA